MRILLLASIALIAACAATPELPPVSRELRDYQLQQDDTELQALEVGEIPQAQQGTLNGQPADCFAPEDSDALASMGVAYHTNLEAFTELERAYHARHAEAAALLAAGRAAEEQAAVYRALYLAETRQGRLIQLATAGAGGLVLLVLSAGAL